MSNSDPVSCISDIAYNAFPDVVKNWIKQELKLKREDIRSYHVKYDKPIVVTIRTIDAKKYHAFFAILHSCKWQKV